MGKAETVKTLLESGKLKEVKRTGWILKGIKNPESVADHSWRMSLIITLLSPKNLDIKKLLEMAAVHDLGEVGIGDIKWESGKRVISSQKIKHKDEIKSLEKLILDDKNGKKIISLVKEFNKQETPEAKFLKEIDKLEMVLQAYEYEKMGYPKKDLNEFWENAEDYIKNSETKPLFKTLLKMRSRL